MHSKLFTVLLFQPPAECVAKMTQPKHKQKKYKKKLKSVKGRKNEKKNVYNIEK